MGRGNKKKCTKCNRGLGGFDDDSDLLHRAAFYLHSGRKQEVQKWEEA